ncbi:MAG TPA: hypothetical protein VK835_01855 [Bacteroidia bacterium]|jgi:hypothetical protein|nr:hypothetical protein [Bacteroidia bacterium]
MVRVFLFLSLVVFAFDIYGQNEETYQYAGMLKATATIAPGLMLDANQTNIYVNGDLEYFADDKISIRGDAFWMVGSQQKNALLKQNSSMFFGALYHFHKNRFDYFIGLQPGISITKPSATNEISFQLPVTAITPREYDYKLLPNFSPVTGVAFYVSDYFNFFLNVRYVYARYFGYQNSSLNLDEFRISAGLGFQIHTKKKEK